MAERRDLDNLAVRDPQHIEFERAEGAVARSPQVARGGRHPVRKGRYQSPVAVAVRTEGALEEWLDLLEAIEMKRLRRHRDPDVLSRDGERGCSIASFVCVDEPLQQLAFLDTGLSGRPLCASGRQVLLHGGASAL